MLMVSGQLRLAPLFVHRAPILFHQQGHFDGLLRSVLCQGRRFSLLESHPTHKILQQRLLQDWLSLSPLQIARVSGLRGNPWSIYILCRSPQTQPKDMFTLIGQFSRKPGEGKEVSQDRFPQTVPTTCGRNIGSKGTSQKKESK